MGWVFSGNGCVELMHVLNIMITFFVLTLFHETLVPICILYHPQYKQDASHNCKRL